MLTLMFFISCERDFVASGDEYTPETTHIRDLYLEKISGEWIHTEISNFSYIKQYYNFKSDGIMSGHILFMTRDSVVINGEKVITDWNRLIDNDIAGEWTLLYKSSFKKNVLYFNARGKFGDSKYVDFIGVNDSVLEIQSPLIISKIIRMHRINDVRIQKQEADVFNFHNIVCPAKTARDKRSLYTAWF